MGRVATELADLTIVTSDNPRSEDPLAIIDEILTGVVGPAEVEPDRREAIARAAAEAGEEDVVVIAGRGAEQYQDVAGEKVPFDDREVVREALRRLRAPA
jgi:UDP-N-acetylmuramyl tripeptide synthase